MLKVPVDKLKKHYRGWVNLQCNAESQSCKQYFLFWETGKFLYEMKILFTIGCIQYTIGLLLFLLKRSIDKVTEDGLKVFKVSGDVEK